MYVPREFADQANNYADSKHTQWLWGEYLNPAWQKCRDEHFATLIIQRCMLIVNAGINPKENYLPGDDLRDYFGLNEDYNE